MDSESEVLGYGISLIISNLQSNWFLKQPLA